MENAPLLTVIIPVYNSTSTLGMCLDTIDADSDSIEVLVVDDGSEDDVAAAVARSSIGSTVRVIRQPHSGVSVARNRGLHESRGQFVMFVDADDQLPPGSLSPFLAEALRSNADICIGDFEFRSGAVQRRIRSLNTNRTDFTGRDAARFQWLCLARVGFSGRKNVGLLGAPWAKIYRRDFLSATFPGLQVFIPGVTRGEDVLANLVAFEKADAVRYYVQPTYIYSLSQTPTSQHVTGAYLQSVEKFSEHLDALLHRECLQHLRPAAAKAQVTLLEEGIRRLGSRPDSQSVRRLTDDPTFASALAIARPRDFSAGGRLKLALLRLRLYKAYIALESRRWQVT